MSVVCRWIGISFSFTLVQLVNSIGGSWGAYMLEAASGCNSEWGISVWVIAESVWVISTGVNYSWIGISGSLSTVGTVSVSVVWVAVTTIAVSSIAVSMSITVASISKTVAMVAIVSIRGCFSFWFSNNGRKKGKGENGLQQIIHFIHFELYVCIICNRVKLLQI